MSSNKGVIFIFAILIGFILSAYASISFRRERFGSDGISEPEMVFEKIWREFDNNYGAFGPKKTDWSALYHLYRPRITESSDDQQLFTVLCEMLGCLNDSHVNLRHNGRYFCAGILNHLERGDFSRRLIKKKYLNSVYKTRMNETFLYGRLNKFIGYLHIKGFLNLESSEAAIDGILLEFKDMEGLIVDVRDNNGGDDLVGQLIANRFADRKRLYLITRIRNGADHNQFTAPRYFHVAPSGPDTFTKTVAVLTNRFSISGAENFALAMGVLPHVTLVGDFTAGCFSDMYWTKAGAWRFSIPCKLFTDHKGFCWEGIGVPADLKVVNTIAQIKAGNDQVLEFAKHLIETGKLQAKEDPDSIKLAKASLARQLKADLLNKGKAHAVQAFLKTKKQVPRTHYLDAEELWMVSIQLLKQGKSVEAECVLDLLFAQLPDDWSCAAFVPAWQEFIRMGSKEAARKIYKNALKIKPRYGWEKDLIQTARMELKEKKP